MPEFGPDESTATAAASLGTADAPRPALAAIKVLRPRIYRPRRLLIFLLAVLAAALVAGAAGTVLKRTSLGAVVVVLAAAALGWLIGPRVARWRALRVGAAVGGYRLQAVLGSGSTSTVYFGRDAKGMPVAVKLFYRLAHEDSAARRARVDAEVAALRLVPSRHVPAVLDVVDTESATAVVTEFISGATLSAVLVRHGHLSGPRACAVLEGALLGLADLHGAGFVHRDVKPDNIVVTPGGASVIVDFGLTRSVELAGSGLVAGSPAYMSPEQAAGQVVDSRSDVWSCGAVLLEALCGARLVTARGEPGSQIQSRAKELLDRAAIPAALAGLTERAVAAQPVLRPVDAADLLAQLRDCAGRDFGPDWRVGAALGALAGTVGVRAVEGLSPPQLPAATASGVTRTPAHAGYAASAIGAAGGLLVASAFSLPLLVHGTPAQASATTQRSNQPSPAAASGASVPASTSASPTVSPSGPPALPMNLSSLLIARLLPGSGFMASAPMTGHSLGFPVPVVNQAELPWTHLVAGRYAFAGQAFSGSNAGYVYLFQQGSTAEALDWMAGARSSAAPLHASFPSIPGALAVTYKKGQWVEFSRGPIIAMVGFFGPDASALLKKAAAAEYATISAHVPA